MSLVKDVAIVLRRLDYSETSQVLAMFTREHGQQRFIAKGVKRQTKSKPSIGIDLLELGDVIFSRRPGKEDVLATLTEWRQIDNFRHLRSDLTRSYAGQYAADVTAQVTEVHDPHPGVFDALRQMLEALAVAEPFETVCRYLWRLLIEIGLRPELERCMSCDRSVAGDTVLYFSSHVGGAICRDCEPTVVEKRRVSPEAAAWLAGDCSGEAVAMPAAFDLLDYHLSHTIGRPSKLTDFLKEAARNAGRKVTSKEESGSAGA